MAHLYKRRDAVDSSRGAAGSSDTVDDEKLRRKT